MEKKDSSEEIWEKLGKDQYMSSAVREVFESVRMGVCARAWMSAVSALMGARACVR